MSDQGWAAFGGVAMVVVLRLLDYYLPRGWVSRGVRKRAIRDHDDDEADLP